jgi:hypothetical protein
MQTGVMHERRWEFHLGFFSMNCDSMDSTHLRNHVDDSFMNNKITLLPLVLLIVSAIDSIRTLPTTAFFGSSLVFFYLLSGLIFLMPVAFISAEFGSRFPKKGVFFTGCVMVLAIEQVFLPHGSSGSIRWFGIPLCSSSLRAPLPI